MDLKSYLPSFYLESVEVVNIHDALNAENEMLKADLEDFKKQFFVSTATWALDFWEQYVGITTNKALDIESRRQNIILKLSSQGTCTRELLISICKNFTGSDVEIIDNLEDYSISIRFLEHGSNIKNLNSLKATVEQIKPAWLGCEFKFTFATHKQLKAYTYKQLKAYTHKQIRDL